MSEARTPLMKVANSRSQTRSIRDPTIEALNDGPVRFDAAGRTGDLDADLAEHLVETYDPIEYVDEPGGADEADEPDDADHTTGDEPGDDPEEPDETD